MSMVDTLAHHATDLARDKARTAAVTAGLWALAFVLLCLALGFGAVAAFVALATGSGTVIAALSVGGGALALALLTAVLASSRGRHHGNADTYPTPHAPARDARPPESLPALLGAGFLTGFLAGPPK